MPDDAPQIGVFAPRTLYRRLSLRAALGFETVVGDVVPAARRRVLRAQPDAELASRASSYGVDRMDYGRRRVQRRRSHGRLRLLDRRQRRALGFGEGLRRWCAAPTSVGAVDYRVTDVREAMLMVFIGGAHSAVRTLVKTLLED